MAKWIESWVAGIFTSVGTTRGQKINRVVVVLVVVLVLVLVVVVVVVIIIIIIVVVVLLLLSCCCCGCYCCCCCCNSLLLKPTRRCQKILVWQLFVYLQLAQVENKACHQRPLIKNCKNDHLFLFTRSSHCFNALAVLYWFFFFRRGIDVINK